LVLPIPLLYFHIEGQQIPLSIFCGPPTGLKFLLVKRLPVCMWICPPFLRPPPDPTCMFINSFNVVPSILLPRFHKTGFFFPANLFILCPCFPIFSHPFLVYTFSFNPFFFFPHCASPRFKLKRSCQSFPLAPLILDPQIPLPIFNIFFQVLSSSPTLASAPYPPLWFISRSAPHRFANAPLPSPPPSFTTQHVPPTSFLG